MVKNKFYLLLWNPIYYLYSKKKTTLLIQNKKDRSFIKLTINDEKHTLYSSSKIFCQKFRLFYYLDKYTIL